MQNPKILFVCLGNICRSPMAEIVMRHRAQEAGVALEAASAGTSGWHNGESMHSAAALALEDHGIAADCAFVSSAVPDDAPAHYDFLVAMDDDNLAELEKRFGRQPQRIFKLTDKSAAKIHDFVPDPWYTGNFRQTFEIIDECCRSWLAEMRAA